MDLHTKLGDLTLEEATEFIALVVDSQIKKNFPELVRQEPDAVHRKSVFERMRDRDALEQPVDLRKAYGLPPVEQKVFAPNTTEGRLLYIIDNINYKVVPEYPLDENIGRNAKAFFGKENWSWMEDNMDLTVFNGRERLGELSGRIFRDYITYHENMKKFIEKGQEIYMVPPFSKMEMKWLDDNVNPTLLAKIKRNMSTVPFNKNEVAWLTKHIPPYFSKKIQKLISVTNNKGGPPIGGGITGP